MPSDDVRAALEGCLGFILEADRLKGVERRVKPVGMDRYENSAEHSWQVALLAMTLVRFANEPVDVPRVLKMLLLHDLAEIDTGDTIVYDLEDGVGPTPEERRAMARILADLPADLAAEYASLWEEFEAERTPEARYARAVDRVMPMLQNLRNDGQSWREHGISKSQVYAKNGKVAAGSAVLWEHVTELVERLYPPGGDTLDG